MYGKRTIPAQFWGVLRLLRRCRYHPTYKDSAYRVRCPTHLSFRANTYIKKNIAKKFPLPLAKKLRCQSVRVRQDYLYMKGGTLVFVSTLYTFHSL